MENKPSLELILKLENKLKQMLCKTYVVPKGWKDTDGWFESTTELTYKISNVMLSYSTHYPKNSEPIGVWYLEVYINPKYVTGKYIIPKYETGGPIWSERDFIKQVNYVNGPVIKPLKRTLKYFQINKKHIHVLVYTDPQEWYRSSTFRRKNRIT